MSRNRLPGVAISTVSIITVILALSAFVDSTRTAHPDSAAAAVVADSSAKTGRDSGSAPSGVTRGDAARGKKLFSTKCVPCHRANGSGGVKITGNPTPDWRDGRRMSDPKFDDRYLRDCITNGKPKSGMPTWSKQGIKPADIENLIAYIHTFAATKK